MISNKVIKVLVNEADMTAQEAADIVRKLDGIHCHPPDVMHRLKMRHGVTVEVVGLAHELRTDKSYHRSVKVYRVSLHD